MGCICSTMGCCWAVFKNGMWDDPVEATTGQLHTDFKEIVQARGLGAQAAEYLTWRYSYLWAAVFFSFVNIFFQWYNFQADGLPTDIREQFEAEFGIAFDPEHFMTFAFHWRFKGIYLFCIFVLSTLVLFRALWLSRPDHSAVQNRYKSSRFVLCSWCIMFLAPFMFLLMFAVRSLIDWDGVESDLCSEFSLRAFRLQPINLTSTIDLLRTVEEEVEGVSLFAANTEGVPTCTAFDYTCHGDLAAWCTEKGIRLGQRNSAGEVGAGSWADAVHLNLAACALRTEELCRNQLCIEAPLVQRLTCIEDCTGYWASPSTSPDQSRAVEFFKEQNCAGLQAYLRQAVENIQFDRDNPATGLLQAANNQKVALSGLWEAGRSAGTALELATGTYIGSWTAQLLLPGALSIVAGMAEGLLNVKVAFPGHQHASTTLAIAVLLPLPIYLGFFAIFQQIFGDVFFSISCIMLCAYLCASFLTAYRSMEMRSGQEERWTLYRKVWCEYGFRALTLIGSAIAFLFFFRFNSIVRSALQEEIKALRWTDGVLMFSSFLAQKGRVAVAFTDIFMKAHMRGELWTDLSPQESTDIERETLKDLGSLLLPDRYEEVFGDFKEIELSRPVAQMKTASGKMGPAGTGKASIKGTSSGAEAARIQQQQRQQLRDAGGAL